MPSAGVVCCKTQKSIQLHREWCIIIMEGCFMEPTCGTDKPDHENWKVLPLVADRSRTQIRLLKTTTTITTTTCHLAEESPAPRQLPALHSPGFCLSYRGQPASRSSPCWSSPHSMIRLGSQGPVIQTDKGYPNGQNLSQNTHCVG